MNYKIIEIKNSMDNNLKDDLGLIVSPEAPTFTHYVNSFFIDEYNGTPWLCASLHIFSPDDGFDHIATENIKRLRALINNHIRLTTSLVVVAYWSNEPGSHQDIAKKIKTIKSCDFTVEGLPHIREILY